MPKTPQRYQDFNYYHLKAYRSPKSGEYLAISAILVTTSDWRYTFTGNSKRGRERRLLSAQLGSPVRKLRYASTGRRRRATGHAKSSAQPDVVILNLSLLSLKWQFASSTSMATDSFKIVIPGFAGLTSRRPRFVEPWPQECPRSGRAAVRVMGQCLKERSLHLHSVYWAFLLSRHNCWPLVDGVSCLFSFHCLRDNFDSSSSTTEASLVLGPNFTSPATHSVPSCFSGVTEWFLLVFEMIMPGWYYYSFI